MERPNPMTFTDNMKIDALILNEQVRDMANAEWTGEAQGDTEYYASSTEKARLPIGNTGEVYMVSGSGVPAWMPILAGRQGGSATNFSTSGSVNQPVEGAIRFQAGAASWNGSATSGSVIVTYPVAFSKPPLPIVSLHKNASDRSSITYNISTDETTLTVGWISAGLNMESAVHINWLAIGEV